VAIAFQTLWGASAGTNVLSVSTSSNSGSSINWGVALIVSSTLPLSVSDSAHYCAFGPIQTFSTAGSYTLYASYGRWSGSSNTTPTLHLTATGDAAFVVFGLSGVALPPQTDVYTDSTGGSTNSYTCSGTPQSGLDEIFVSWWTDTDVSGETWTVGSGWTEEGHENGASGAPSFMAQYQLFTSTSGLVTATATKSGSPTSYAGALLSFASTSVITGTPVNFLT
jgi:hypothetical protein